MGAGAGGGGGGRLGRGAGWRVCCGVVWGSTWRVGQFGMLLFWKKNSYRYLFVGLFFLGSSFLISFPLGT